MNPDTITSASDVNARLKQKGFIAFEVENGTDIARAYKRKDFYKICLVSGKSIVEYADKGIVIEGNTLFFGTPYIPYSWETVSREQTGYTCLFTEEFIKAAGRSESLQESPLFKIGGTPIFTLTPEQRTGIIPFYQKMIAEQSSDYVYKNDLFRNYIQLIIHEALRLQPSENYFRHQHGATRIASLFLDLLERQFPIERNGQPLQLKTPQDYAQRLSIHVNHLNRAVKEVTGKPTSTHITERIVTESRLLLQHTDWTIAEIGYALGFEYPSYFNTVFKKMTGTTPSSIRD